MTTVHIFLFHFLAQGWLQVEKDLRGAVADAHASVIQSVALSNGYVPFVSDEGETLTDREYAEREAMRAGVNPELILALIEHESDWNPKIRSSAGAIGLMQVMPSNMKFCGLDPTKPKLLENSRINITCGVKIFAEAMRTHQNDVLVSLWDYNGGPDAVKALKKCSPRDGACLGGYSETVRHARLVMEIWAKSL